MKKWGSKSIARPTDEKVRGQLSPLTPCFCGLCEPGSADPSFSSSTCYKTEPLGMSDSFLCAGSPSRHPTNNVRSTEGNAKHWPQPVAWPHIFFVCYCIADGRGVAGTNLWYNCTAYVPHRSSMCCCTLFMHVWVTVARVRSASTYVRRSLWFITTRVSQQCHTTVATRTICHRADRPRRTCIRYLLASTERTHYLCHGTSELILSFGSLSFVGTNYISRESYIGHSCLCVCLSVPRRIPTLLPGPGCKLEEW